MHIQDSLRESIAVLTERTDVFDLADLNHSAEAEVGADGVPTGDLVETLTVRWRRRA